MPFDLLIVGGGIGGIICLKYARDAGLQALLLERRHRVGGLWCELPSWQDIQVRREDWTLGDLPVTGEDQASILRNIEAWVERFGLARDIRLNAAVSRARPTRQGWAVTTGHETLDARWLVAATGGHNRPVIPQVGRSDPAMAEYHSCALRDPGILAGKRVTVVGGGASAFDLLDLALARGAGRVAWVYRSTRWMRPTRQAKYFGTDVRRLLRFQVLGAPPGLINRMLNRELRARYAKAGIEAILPEREFDIRRDQLLPGRPGMIRDFARIVRHRGEPRRLEGDVVQLSTGEAIPTDVLLWGTGYAADLGYLDVPALAGASSLPGLARRCRGVFRSMDAPNLFLLAPGVLESNTTTPWAYAHAARSIMSQVAGRAVFDDPPVEGLTNHFDLVRMLARRDRRNFPWLRWRLKYLRLALGYPSARPMPLP